MSQKYQFVATHASEYSVRVMCRVFLVSRSGYYAWRTRPQSHRQRQNRLLAVQIGAIFRASRQTYGSPRVRAELHAQGVRCASKQVARLMRQAGLHARSTRRRVRTTTADPALAVAPNLINRDFTASAPNQKWLADITYLPTQEGWMYLAVVLDLFSRRVIGWAMRPTLERDVVISALKQALQQRRPVHDLLHHSDRGSQYASHDYQQQLVQAGIGCSRVAGATAGTTRQWKASLAHSRASWASRCMPVDQRPVARYLITLSAFIIGSGVIRH